MSKHSESLAKACKDLMLDEPFYGLFLIMLNKQWAKDVPTAGVTLSGINYKLLINEEFWKDLSLDHRKGLLKHELLHIAFFHLTDYSDLADKELANIAMDLEINQYIAEKMLPEGGMNIGLFPELKLKEKAGTRYYYEELQKAKQNNKCPNLQNILNGMGNGQTQIEIQVDDEGNIKINLPDHSKWGDGAGDEATKKLVENQTKHILNEIKDQINKSRGKIPGELQSILEKINLKEEPKFDWRGYLRRFAGGSIKVYTKKTRRKYNKRYEDNPGLKIKQRKHVLVAIDTSGSVSSKELVEFMQEINHIHKTGADVTIAQADAAIRNIEAYSPNKEYKIYGRGGTDFTPVIDYYNENTRKYSCLIYLTDGEAPAPETVKGRVLWALSSTSKKTDHLPGLTIQLN